VPSPQARRERQLLKGDVPSPIAPPPGCHLHTRCPFAAELCRQEVPALRDDASGHATRCHFWEDLPDPGRILPQEAEADRRLERLMSAFGADIGAAQAER
jgi:peptide/nickel transport system ATP-binding protein/oligopeptide transport system ATP-binding protein